MADWRKREKKRRILQSMVRDGPFPLHEEPMIYSARFNFGLRNLPPHFFRDKKWFSILRSVFPYYGNSNTPIVVIVRFYVPPPEGVNISYASLREENVPATLAQELFEYGLSFVELLRMTLFRSYRQIVKLEMDKFYSAYPRTEFYFLSWNSYVTDFTKNSFFPKSQGKPVTVSQSSGEPISSGHEQDSSLCGGGTLGQGHADLSGPDSGDSSFQDADGSDRSRKKARVTTQHPAPQKTRRRQPGKTAQ